MGERAKAGHLAVDVLARAGVRRFYTVPGESFLEILDAAERHPETSLVSTRHESGASFMAEAEAKVTGGPAVAMATRGWGPPTSPSACTRRCRTRRRWWSCWGRSRRTFSTGRRFRRSTSPLSTLP